MQAIGNEPSASLQRLRIKLDELIASLDAKFSAEPETPPVESTRIGDRVLAGTENEGRKAQAPENKSTPPFGPDTARPGLISRWILRVFG